MKKLFFPLLAGVVFLACEKEDEPVGIEGNWIRTESYSVDHSGNRSHNLLSFAPDCQKDDIYEFTAGRFFIKEGALSASLLQPRMISIRSTVVAFCLRSWVSGRSSPFQLLLWK